MVVDKEEVQRLEGKIDKLEADLVKAKERLRRIKPIPPITLDGRKWEGKKLIAVCEYYCPHCGCWLNKPKSKAISRHKCGQMIDWQENKKSI